MTIDPLLKRPQVEALTGLSRSGIYNRIQCGTFPRPVKLGARAVVWPQSEIAAWIEARKAEAARRNAG